MTSRVRHVARVWREWCVAQPFDESPSCPPCYRGGKHHIPNVAVLARGSFTRRISITCTTGLHGRADACQKGPRRGESFLFYTTGHPLLPPLSCTQAGEGVGHTFHGELDTSSSHTSLRRYGPGRGGLPYHQRNRHPLFPPLSGTMARGEWVILLSAEIRLDRPPRWARDHESESGPVTP